MRLIDYSAAAKLFWLPCRLYRRLQWTCC